MERISSPVFDKIALSLD